MITGWTRLGLDRDDPSVRSIGEIGKRQREIMERKRRVPLFFFFQAASNRIDCATCRGMEGSSTQSSWSTRCEQVAVAVVVRVAHLRRVYMVIGLGEQHQLDLGYSGGVVSIFKH